MLVAAANALLTAVDEGDTVARVGGDEYVVVSLVGCDALHARVRQVLNEDSAADDHPFALRASTGMVTTADPDTMPERLLETADHAMYAEKKSKQNTRG